MKKVKNSLIVCMIALLALCMGLFVACNPDDAEVKTQKELAAVTNFTFDFDTLEYSFTGVENASFYQVDVTEKGGMNVLASSGRITSTGTVVYSGALEGVLMPGQEYTAKFSAFASGYRGSNVTKDGKSMSLAAPSVEATFSEQNEAMGIKITITANDEIASAFTVTVAKDGTIVYTNSAAGAGELSLAAADLDGIESISEDDSYMVTVKANASGEYKASVETTVKVTKEQQAGPGGPGQPGGMSIELVSVDSFEEGTETITVTISFMNQNSPLIGTLGDDGVYTLSGSGGMGEAITGTFTLNEDMTAVCKVDGFGPFAAMSETVSYTNTDGTIVVTVA